MSKCYSELIKLKTFEERFQYLKLDGQVGEDTFGYDRYLNQVLYRSQEWRNFRREIIVRDNGCDMAVPDYPINGRFAIIHHINPITKEDILNRSANLFDKENVVCVSHKTHNAIHYGGSEEAPIQKPIVRTPNDTCPWKR